MNIESTLSKHQKLAGRGLPQYDTQTTRAAAAGLSVDDLMREARALNRVDPGLSIEQHFSRLMRQHPESYARYLAENSAQTGGRR